jgi:hypothetical protein
MNDQLEPTVERLRHTFQAVADQVPDAPPVFRALFVAAAPTDDTSDEEMVVDIQRARRDGTSRRRWVVAAAAVVAVVVLIAGIVLLQGTGDDHVRSKPAAPGPVPTTATPPTTTPPATDPAAYVAVADSFMDAWVAGDGNRVVEIIGMARVAALAGQPNQVALGGWELLDVAALPAVHDWFRALGWEFRREPCRVVAHAWPEIPDSATFACRYTYENDLTRAVGRAPVPGKFVFNVVDDKVARFNGGMFHLDADIWQLFSDWLRSEHPDDFAAMYYPTAPPAPRLDQASIALWDRHVEEFVNSPEAHTPAPGPPTRAQFGAKARMICATVALETQPYGWVFTPEMLARTSQSVMEQLRALPRPTEDAAEIDQLFSLLEEINSRVVLDTWFHQIDHLIAEKDALGGRDFWGCPVELGG